MSDRDAFREAREHGLAARQAKRLEAATYTAAEVKVLTETAGEAGRRIGWKAAGEAIAEAMDSHPGGGQISTSLVALLARSIASLPPGATSDATSGVPRHSEVSEAARSPQDCPGCGQDGTGLESHNRDCPQNPYAASPQEPCGHPTCLCADMHSHPEGNTR